MPPKSDVLQQLINILGKDNVLMHQEAAMRPAGGWGNASVLNVLALVRPSTTAEVSAVLRVCNAAKQPVVPHGGLSNVVGSARAGENEIVISLERMNIIEEIDENNKTATVQAGVILQNLHAGAAEKGLLFPLDLGAKGSCMIGGNIATNAGGLQAIRYGVARQLVLGLEVVLADGTILSSMNRMMKNNAGYDLKHLFIGSEGTLGIITRAVLKLEIMPHTRNTAFIAVESFDKAAELLQVAKNRLAGTLNSFELLWSDYYELMTTPPSKFRPPLQHGYPYYVLLETRGINDESDKGLFEALLEDGLTSGLIADAAIAQTQQELDWFWGIREQVEYILTIRYPVFLFDVSLPISEMEGYVNEIKTNLAKAWGEYYLYVFGHMGDGNLHMFMSDGSGNANARHQGEEIGYTPLQKFGGSISAEHGIGLEKKAWLHLSRSKEEIALMKAIKQTLDPNNILNPGKIF